jgi:hypothetical protein
LSNYPSDTRQSSLHLDTVVVDADGRSPPLRSAVVEPCYITMCVFRFIMVISIARKSLTGEGMTTIGRIMPSSS